MKVNDSNSSYLDYSRELDEKMKKQNAAKESEIEHVKDIYNKRIEAAKTVGEGQYAETLNKNSDKILEANKHYEEKLNSYKKNLDETQKNISKEEIALKSDHQEKMKGAKEQYLNSIHDEYQNASEKQETISDQVQNSVQIYADKARNERSRIESKSKTELNALASDYNQKGINEERNFRSQLEADVKAHEAEVRLQKGELKKIIDKESDQNKRIEEEKIKSQKAELTFLDNHQKDMLTQKQTDFQVRYENMVKEHEATLAELKSHLESDVKKMLEQNSTQKKIISSKSEDQFYRIETLNPTVTETEKELHVSLKVPEFERENVHLSVHGRDVKMTLSRKYADTLESADGSTNRSTRNELFSKEFSSKEILNPKLISQKYENGLLSFKIQKA